MERTRFDINAGCTIDETGLIVSHQSRGKGARCSDGYNSGKKYFECKVNLVLGGTNVGLCDASNSLETLGWPSSASLFITMFSHMYRICFGSEYKQYSYSSPGYTNPAIIGMAIDFDSRTITYYYNGMLLASEVYENKVTQLDAVRYPFTCSGGTNNKAINEFNFGTKPFVYSVPEGYQPWDNVNQRLYLQDNAIYGMQSTP